MKNVNTNIISCKIKDYNNIHARYLDTYELTRRVLHALTFNSYNMRELTVITGITDYKLKHYIIDFLTVGLITYTNNKDTSDHKHKSSKIFHITQLGRDTLTKLNTLYSMIGYECIPINVSSRLINTNNNINKSILTK